MKRDFSQPFTENTAVYCIIHTPKGYLIQYPLDDPHGSDFYSLVQFEYDRLEQLSQAVCRSLYRLGIVVNSFRELARKHALTYSFIDETPGLDTAQLCLFIDADLADNFVMDDAYDSTQPSVCSACEPGAIPHGREFALFVDMCQKLTESPYSPEIVKAGLSLLAQEVE